MHYFPTENNITVENLQEINLLNTFDCGQCFRWNQQKNGDFKGIFKKKVLNISQQEGNLILKNTTINDFENIWSDYLDLNLDYVMIRNSISQMGPTLKSAAEFSNGIRILRQDPWEALCSFIISQNNNIPRIKGIIERFCRLFGQAITDTDFAFPSVQAVSSLTEQDLAPLRCGFRAPYILDAAKKVASGQINLQEIAILPLEKAREQLKTIKGVGPKVAECVLLYGMHRLDAFPIDVWMTRAMNEYFPGKTPKDFGKFAGIAQQYIFHYARTNFGKTTKIKENSNVQTTKKRK